VTPFSDLFGEENGTGRRKQKGQVLLLSQEINP
jgi:hypothetical protein